MKYACKKCGKQFDKKSSLGGHGRTHGKRKLKQAKPRSRICRFCGKKFDKDGQVGGHQVWCTKNPKRKTSAKKLAKSQTGKKHTQKTKTKLQGIANKKVKNGTWHSSFSRCRTYKYKGESLYGTWELRYAKYLDEKGIKWRRPAERFAYRFEDRTRYYIPDFYLSETSTYIEIKGYETEKDRAKWRDFPSDLKHQVLKGCDLVKMGILQENEVKKI